MANAKKTPPANLKPVRSPTAEERNQLWHWFVESDLAEIYGLEERDWHVSFSIAVFDDYCTGGPGYCGKVLYLVWDGAPSFCTVFTFDQGQLVLEGEHGDACCSGRPAFDAAPALLKALRHAYQRLNEIPHTDGRTDFTLLREAIQKAEGTARDTLSSPSPNETMKNHKTTPAGAVCASCDSEKAFGGKVLKPGACNVCVVAEDLWRAAGEVLVKHYPEAVYGDVSPLVTLAVDEAHRGLVKEWVSSNVPTADHENA